MTTIDDPDRILATISDGHLKWHVDPIAERVDWDLAKLAIQHEIQVEAALDSGQEFPTW